MNRLKLESDTKIVATVLTDLHYSSHHLNRFDRLKLYRHTT